MELKKYTKEELALILDKHAKWLRGQDGGERANLRYADLRYADLSYANLSGANLSYADLSYADLSYANLSYANLSYANLSGANLSYADLRCANLRYADLSYADLSYADLSYANLSYADLRCAVHAWAQVAFRGHGECGRMLTAVICKEGDEATYQCGCFIGSLADLKEYIKDGDERLRESRILAMNTATKLLTA